MITLKVKGPEKEVDLFVDVLCHFGLIKTYSHKYNKDDRTKVLVKMEAGVPAYLFSIFCDREANCRFINEEMLTHKAE